MASEEMNAEADIRAVIESWASAVRAKDIDGVLANHTQDVTMFDVPPPVAVRGINAYRDTWPQFFDWLRRDGGSFDIATLDITAGEQVAFATATVLCASRAARQEDETPRLRLTVGLRRDGSGWKIAHEHHSYPLGNAA